MSTPTAMQLHAIPNFCGGRILTNFFYYQENQFETFFKFVVQCLGSTANKGNLGMIVAFTNRQQKVAEGFLERLGFKRVAVTDKYGNYNRETGESNSNDTSPCITWTGDWYNDVLPKIQEHLKELEAQRSTAAATSNLRRPAAPTPPQPVPPARPAMPSDAFPPYSLVYRRANPGMLYRVVSPSARGLQLWCAPLNSQGSREWVHTTDAVLYA